MPIWSKRSVAIIKPQTEKLMSNPLDTLSKYPVFWLGICLRRDNVRRYNRPDIRRIAAGSATAFLTLAGTFGYRSMTRRTIETRLNKKSIHLELNKHIWGVKLPEPAMTWMHSKTIWCKTALTLQKNWENSTLSRKHRIKPMPPSAPIINNQSHATLFFKRWATASARHLYHARNLQMKNL